MITSAQFTTAVERAVTTTSAQVSGDIELIDDYSGRGMEGRTCIGVALDSISAAITLFTANLTLELRNLTNVQSTDELAAALAGVRFDSLGLGIVVYFPQWEYIGDEMREGAS